MRFTERYDDILATTKDGKETHEKGVRIKDKVGGFEKFAKLEDIEDELGIDLIVLLKALILNEEIFYKDSNENINSTENEISLNMDGDGLCLHIRNIGYFFVKDYGRTWALTKEELENE